MTSSSAGSRTDGVAVSPLSSQQHRTRGCHQLLDVVRPQFEGGQLLVLVCMVIVSGTAAAIGCMVEQPVPDMRCHPQFGELGFAKGA